MATDTVSQQSTDEQTEGDPPDELPQRLDGGRWAGDVIGTAHGTIEWGTHSFDARIQAFADERWSLQIDAPSDPPHAADALLADLLNGHGVQRAAAQMLACEWDIDIEEVTA